MPQYRYLPQLREDSRVLERHHVDLPPRQAQVIALEAAGLSHAEIASAIGTSLATVRNSAYAARNKVVPGSRFRSRNYAVAWAWMHSACCLPQTRRRIDEVTDYAARLDAIDDAHRATLSSQKQAVLVAQSLGHSVRTTADLLGIASRTVQFHNDDLRHQILPDDFDEGHTALITWVHRHASCCLSPTWRTLIGSRAG